MIAMTPGKERSTAVLDVRGLQCDSEQNIVAAVPSARVLEVAVNPVAQRATVVFDPARTSLAELRRCVIECGYHCAGQSVPAHACDPMAEPDPPAPRAAAVAVPGPGVPLPGPAPAVNDGHAVPPVTRDGQAAEQAPHMRTSSGNSSMEPRA
jgi:P-type Cu2+ transporter